MKMLVNPRILAGAALLMTLSGLCATDTVRGQNNASDSTGRRIRDPFAELKQDNNTSRIVVAAESRDRLSPASSNNPAMTQLNSHSRFSNASSSEQQEMSATGLFGQGSVMDNSDMEIATPRSRSVLATGYATSTGPDPISEQGQIIYQGEMPVHETTVGSYHSGHTQTPFMFSSASAKRNFFGTSDFAAIPNGDCACDEWLGFCGCGQCGNDLGLDIFRRRPCHSGLGKCHGNCGQSSSCGSADCGCGTTSGTKRTWGGWLQPSFGANK
jgi:hypothetical protein